MAYTESKAYDLRNVKYQGTRIGGTDQISTSPIQYKGTPVPYMRYKNNNIMHRYTVRNGDDYRDEYDYEADYDDNILAGVYSVSLTNKNGEKYTDIPAPDPYSNLKIYYEYYISKYELTRTSGTKNESKYYLYAFTIILKAYIVTSSDIDRFKFRADKYDYLSTDDISLDTLAAQIEDQSGGTEGFTPPWKLGIPRESILETTRRERQRTDDVERIGNFIDFSNRDVESEGELSPWGSEFESSTYNGIFNQGAEGLIVDFYPNSSSSSKSQEIGNGTTFNFDRVVDAQSEADIYHVSITDCNCTNNYSSCRLGWNTDDRHLVYVTDANNMSRSSDDYRHFNLIFLICSSCSNSALGNGSNKIELTYYHEDYTQINANLTYNNFISTRDY